MELSSSRWRLVSAKRSAVLLMKCQNNRDSAWRTITKFCLTIVQIRCIVYLMLAVMLPGKIHIVEWVCNWKNGPRVHLANANSFSLSYSSSIFSNNYLPSNDKKSYNIGPRKTPNHLDGLGGPRGSHGLIFCQTLAQGVHVWQWRQSQVVTRWIVFNGLNPAFCVYFCSFHMTNITMNDKSINGMLGTQTQGSCMVSVDKFTELWWPPSQDGLLTKYWVLRYTFMIDFTSSP